MFVRYRHPFIYTVLQSVRTPQGPRSRCVAHWSGTPSLPDAIARTKRWMAEGDALAARHGTTNNPGVVAHRDRQLRHLEQLEAARAVLGDWVDPVGRDGRERAAARKKQAADEAAEAAEMR